MVNITWIKSIWHSKMTVHKQTPFSLSRNTSEEVGVTKGRSEFNHPASEASLLPFPKSMQLGGRRGGKNPGHIGYFPCEFMVSKGSCACCQSRIIQVRDTNGNAPALIPSGISRETFPAEACCLVTRSISACSADLSGSFSGHLSKAWELEMPRKKTWLTPAPAWWGLWSATGTPRAHTPHPLPSIQNVNMN